MIRHVSEFKGDENKIVCQFCEKTITEIINGKAAPSYQECYANGCIPVPNFGWLCSFECAEKFETVHEVKFMRTPQGKIDYYDGNLG